MHRDSRSSVADGSSRTKKAAFTESHGKFRRILPDAASLIVVVLGVVLVYHGVIRYFFAQDDFVSLWIAREGPGTVWRILSSFVHFRIMSALFGLNPAAFHVVSLLLHVVNAALVFLVARSLSLDRASSLFSAVFFAVHPSLYVALYSISSIGEIESCLFVLLATLYLLRARRPENVTAILVVCGLFAASLLSKENTILFPLLVPFVYVLRKVNVRGAIFAGGALVAMSCAYAGFLYANNVFGLRGLSSGGGAYAVSLGPALVTSVQTYFKWAFDIVESWYYDPVNLLEKNALPWLLGGTAFLVLLVYARGSNRWKSAFCVAWFLLMLLPAIPLTSHPYHYYLYVPLAGFSPVLGMFLSERLGKSQWKPMVFSCLIALLLLNSGALMQKMERATIAGTPMRADPTFDRAVVARNMIVDLAKRHIPRGAKLLMVSPLTDIREGRIILSPSFAEGSSYWDSNVRSAVAQGVGVKVFFPQVDTVAFADEPRPGNEDFYLFPYQWDGHLREIEPAHYWTEVGVRNLGESPSFAARCFENAVNSDSLYAEPYYYLARIYLSEARLGPGATALRKYVALAPAGAGREQAQAVLRDLAARGY